MKKTLLVSLVIVFCLAGCSSTHKKNGQADDVTPLTVYIVAPRMHGDADYAYTDYALGEFMGLQQTFGEESYWYYQALSEYERSHPVDLTVEYFNYTEDLDRQLQQDIENNAMPDVIIENSMSGNDIYKWLEQDIFLDIKDYMTQFSMYNSGAYYDAILSSGIYKSQQVILPLCFNMNTFMTSEQNLRKYDLNLEEHSLNGWILQWMQQCKTMGENKKAGEVLAQFISPMTNFPIHIILSAAGQKYIDYENENVLLDKEFFYNLSNFYKEFSLQEANDFESLCNPQYQFMLQNTQHEDRYGNMLRFDAIHENTLGFIEGGSCYNTYPHSFAAQANYYESRYHDMDEAFCLYGIPSLDDTSRYTAMVTSWGAVIKNTEYPAAAFDFLKYILDHPYFMHYDLSVNQKVTEGILTDLSETEYHIIQTRGYFENTDDEDTDPDYIMKPMSPETKSQITSIIDDIGYVTLPNWPVYCIIIDNMGEYVMDQVTLEECYENTISQLTAYMAEIHS